MMAEKFTQPSSGRAVFAAALAHLVGQPRLDRLRGMPLLHRFAARKSDADTGSSFARGTGDRPRRPGCGACLRLGC